MYKKDVYDYIYKQAVARGDKFKNLLDYIDANDGSWGWRCRYEKSLFQDGKVDRAYMSGFYGALLDDALSLIHHETIDRIRHEHYEGGNQVDKSIEEKRIVER